MDELIKDTRTAAERLLRSMDEWKLGKSYYDRGKGGKQKQPFFDRFHRSTMATARRKSIGGIHPEEIDGPCVFQVL